MPNRSGRHHLASILPHGDESPNNLPNDLARSGSGDDATPLPGLGDQPPGSLRRHGDQVLYQLPEGGEEVAVRVLWARPLSGRGGAVSFLQAGKKHEVAYFSSLEALSQDSQRIALEELSGGMILARITSIRSIRMHFGNYYWDVVTEQGKTRFLLTSPENNFFVPFPGCLIIRDVYGNCFEINPLFALDRSSRLELDRVY
ncbi:MAG: DUF1854 domain-containing protein [Planctomycetota bacterium]|jgi:hypothetical protein|nr:DUF1854 domain-containing protein [Planctomycetota bacterium]